MPIPTFQDSRRNALRLLGDAADEIRAGDWADPSPTASQRKAILRALQCISEAKAALDQAARTDGGDDDD